MVFIYMFVDKKKNLNCTLEIDSPFQTFAVGLLVLSKSRISIFNVHLALFVRRMTSHNSIGKYRHRVGVRVYIIIYIYVIKKNCN